MNSGKKCKFIEELEIWTIKIEDMEIQTWKSKISDDLAISIGVPVEIKIISE